MTATCASGDYYLVDLGRLISVAAASVRDSVHLAVLELGGPEKIGVDHPVVYRLDPEGQPVAMYDLGEIERGDAQTFAER